MTNVVTTLGAASRSTSGNLLATALTRTSDQWKGIFQTVPLRAGETIVLQGVRPSWVYWPISGLVSALVNPSGEPAKGEYGDELQVAMLGSEDLVGLQGLLGASQTTYQAVVDVGGEALRASAESVRRVLADDDASRALVLRYVDLMLAESWQVAASAMEHSNEARVATWLLRMARILGGHKALPVTHLMMTKRLGIRRATVTTTLQAMEKAGVICQQGRGRIDIIDLSALNALAVKTWPLMVSQRQAFTSELRVIAAG